MLEDNFDHLTAPNVEISPQPETFSGQIENEAWDSLRVTVEIYDYAGRGLQRLALRAPAFRDRNGTQPSTP